MLFCVNAAVIIADEEGDQKAEASIRRRRRCRSEAGYDRLGTYLYALFSELSSLVPHACAHTVEADSMVGGAVAVKSCFAVRGDSILSLLRHIVADSPLVAGVVGSSSANRPLSSVPFTGSPPHIP